MDDYIENRISRGTQICRVPLELVIDNPRLFDTCYDIAAARLGGPCLAQTARDKVTNKEYLYFYRSHVRIIGSPPAVPA